MLYSIKQKGLICFTGYLYTVSSGVSRRANVGQSSGTHRKMKAWLLLNVGKRRLR